MEKGRGVTVTGKLSPEGTKENVEILKQERIRRYLLGEGLDPSQVEEIIDYLKPRGLENLYNQALKKDGETDSEKVTTETIRQQAERYLDFWMGEPDGFSPERKGYMVRAFLNGKNLAEGITQEDLTRWLPGYTVANMHALGVEIIKQARERDIEEGEGRWQDLVS